jgi:hypothetical protein
MSAASDDRATQTPDTGHWGGGLSPEKSRQPTWSMAVSSQ